MQGPLDRTRVAFVQRGGDKDYELLGDEESDTQPRPLIIDALTPSHISYVVAHKNRMSPEKTRVHALIGGGMAFVIAIAAVTRLRFAHD